MHVPYQRLATGDAHVPVAPVSVDSPESPRNKKTCPYQGDGKSVTCDTASDCNDSGYPFRFSNT